MKITPNVLLLSVLFAANLHAQENQRPGNPIKGAVIKMGTNQRGDIATQSSVVSVDTTVPQNSQSNGENYKPGQPIKGSIIKMGRNPGGDIATQSRLRKRPELLYQNMVDNASENLTLEPDEGEQAGGSRTYYVGHVTLLKKNGESDNSNGKLVEKTGHVTLLKRNGTEENIDSKRYYVGHVTLLKRNGTEEEVDSKKYYVGHVTLLKRNGDDDGNRNAYVGHVTLLKRNPDDAGLNERDYYVGHVTLLKKNGESENSKIVDKTGHVTLLKRNSDDSQANGRYRPGNTKTAGIKITREWSNDQTFKRPPVWIYADGGAILPNVDAKQWLGLKEGYQFNVGAAIPINQRFGFSIQGSYSGNGSNNTPAPASTIKYMNNGNVVALNNNQQQKATMSSFNIMAGPTIFKNLGPKFYIQPSILFGYNHFNYTGMSSGDSASFNGNSMPIILNQTNNQSSGQFAIRPDLKFGILLSPRCAIQASVDYTVLPKISLTTTTFQPEGGPNAQGYYEFQQLQKGTYTTQTQTINPSYIHASVGLTIALASKHAIGTKGMGAQTFSDNTEPSEYKDPEDMTTRSKLSDVKSNPLYESKEVQNPNQNQPDSTKSSPDSTRTIQDHAIGTKGMGAQIRMKNPNNEPSSEGYAITTKGTGGQIRMKNPNQNNSDSSHTQAGGTDKVTVQSFHYFGPYNKKNARMIGGKNGKADLKDISIMRRIRASHDSTYVPNPNDYTIEVHIGIGRETSTGCRKGGGFCLVVVIKEDGKPNSSKERNMTMVQNPVDSVLVVSIPEELLKKGQPDALKYFKGKKEFAMENDWKASDEINNALHATTPIQIQKGGYPMMYENGVYYIAVWLGKKGYDYWKAHSE